jgi:hypothetical protein
VLAAPKNSSGAVPIEQKTVAGPTMDSPAVVRCPDDTLKNYRSIVRIE